MRRVISERPASHAIAPDGPDEPTVRQAVLRRFPYRLVFLEHDDAIVIVAVAHLRKRAWLLGPARSLSSDARVACVTASSPSLTCLTAPRRPWPPA